MEAILDASEHIEKSAVVGDNFLNGSSQAVCAIVQPVVSQAMRAEEIIKAVAQANRVLPPPLRISWSRVLILDDGDVVPITRKGGIWRKKLEDLFGSRIRKLVHEGLEGSALKKVAPALFEEESLTKPKPKDTQNSRSRDKVIAMVESIVLEALRVTSDILDANEGATFAEVRSFRGPSPNALESNQPSCSWVWILQWPPKLSTCSIANLGFSSPLILAIHMSISLRYPELSWRSLKLSLTSQTRDPVNISQCRMGYPN